MKKLCVLFTVCLFACCKIYADEGMWLINLLDKNLYSRMKEKGLKLPAKQIYNEEGASVKDAVIALDGGMCSGSIISEQGLLITNHHCAYGDIHALSTPDKNYLENGFWAFEQTKEIPIKGKSVTFLRKVIDVTEQATRIIDSIDRSGHFVLFKINKVCEIISKQYDTPYETYLASMWKGNKYYLFFYETFNDIRLVGAPPISVGAFGGEQDNWGWPQHRGDFAMYRVYGSKDGKPAEYSKENVPLQCSTYLKISSKGVKEGDFTMILGYPGVTNRYISSYELKEKRNIVNPLSSEIKRSKLDIWKKYMDHSPVTRLKYQDRYLVISNSADYAKWENKCLDRYNVIGEIEKREKELSDWIEADSSRKERFGNVQKNLAEIIKCRSKIIRAKEVFSQSMINGSDFVLLGQRFIALTRIGGNDTLLQPDNSRVKGFLRKHAKPAYSKIDYNADKELLEKMLTYFMAEVPAKFYSRPFKTLLEKCNNNLSGLSDYVFSNSVLTDSLRLIRFFSKAISVKDIQNDPVSAIVSTTMIKPFNDVEKAIMDSLQLSFSKENARYQTALYLMRKEKKIPLYPDANSTMRLTYGNVGAIAPSDGVYYHWQSTIKGILQKYDEENYEFNLKPGYKKLLEETDGNIGVNFLSDNDITGGNSGSAVLNCYGELIGLAFDGNRESMCGDVYFKDGYCKTVSVDIRYVLWYLKNSAGATNIIKEVDIN